MGIEKTFIYSVGVLLIYYDEKSLEWAQEVWAVPPPSEDHQEYKTGGPIDIKSEGFAVWLQITKVLILKIS